MDVRNKQQNIGFGILNIRFDTSKTNPKAVEKAINAYNTGRITTLPFMTDQGGSKTAIKLGLVDFAKTPEAPTPNERHLVKKIWRVITDHAAELTLAARLRKFGATVKRTLDPMLAHQHFQEDKKWLSKP